MPLTPEGVLLQVRHIRWQQLCDASPCVRRMLHWTADDADAEDDGEEDDVENGLQQPHNTDDPATAAQDSSIAGNGTAAAAADPAAAADSSINGSASSPLLAAGRWRVLGRHLAWPLARLVRGQLAAEHKAWLRVLGWPLRRRPRRSRHGQQQQLLQPDVIASIVRKLARRPLAVGVTPALVAAAGLGPGSSRAARQHIAPRKLRVQPGAEPGSPGVVDDAAADAAGGAAGRLPSGDAARRGGQRARKRRVLLDEFSSDVEKEEQQQQQVSWWC
jgi:hypothetical protein